MEADLSGPSRRDFEPARCRSANDSFSAADIKSSNVLLDYMVRPDGSSVDVERVHLIDTENALPVKDEHYMFDLFSHLSSLPV